MNFTNYFLLSILYFWASSTALSFGVGYYTVYRPVVSGLLTGLILGDPFVGMMAGAVVNLIYIDFVSTGGSFKGDQCLTAMIAAVAAIILHLNPVEAAAAAYPFGYLGILIWKYRLNINSIFVRKYEKEYNEGKGPNISLYDGSYPQLLLYIMSTAVILSAVFILLVLKDFIIGIRDALFLAGLFLTFVSTFNILYKLHNMKSIVIFSALLIITLFTNISSYIIFVAALVILVKIANKNLILYKYKHNKENSIINKKDLIYTWFIWKNFSHSCYSYERFQGLAFAHSLKNIFKKLYTTDKERDSFVHKHSESFNTEPNIGSPILGYIISLEEDYAQNHYENNIIFIKKGMMGIAAGMGDSYTQVVLTPIFICMSLMLCLDEKFVAAIIPMILLASIILLISYTGLMKGYYEGKQSLIERINIVKNSNVKLYFPFIFSGILGVSLGKLMIQQNIFYNLTIFGAVGIISMIYTLVKIKRSHN